MDLKEQYLYNALDRFKEMIRDGQCSKQDISYFCGISKYELNRRGIGVDKHQWLTKEESCELLGISSSTFDRIVRRQILPRGKKIPKERALVWNCEQVEQLRKRILLKSSC